MNQYPATNFHDLNLDWLLQQMKTCISEWNTTKGEWDTLEAENEAFKTYVTTYLENLDLSEEVSDKINTMVDSGEFLALITEDTGDGSPLSDTVGTWCAAHINQEDYPVDDTLTVPHAAADAYVTGQRITDIKDAITKSATYPQIQWVVGAIHPINGNPNSATNAINVINFIPHNMLSVSISNGYNCGLFAYQLNGVYVGVWNGSEFVAAYNQRVNLSEVNFEYFRRTFPNYEFRITVYSDDSSTMTTSNYNKAIFTQTLEAGKPDYISIEPGNLFDAETINVNKLASVSDLGQTVGQNDSSNINNFNFLCAENSVYIVSGTSHYVLITDMNDKVITRLSNPSANVADVIIPTGPHAYKIYVNYRPAVYPSETYMAMIGTTLPETYHSTSPNVYVFNGKARDNAITTNIINVANTDSITEIVNSIKDASETNQYILMIAAGTYDIYSEIGGADRVAEIASDDSVYWDGIILPPYVHLIGATGNAKDVVLQLIVPDNETVELGCNKLSVLNTYGTNTIKNLTLEGKNIRYNWHDEDGHYSEFEAIRNKTRIAENVIARFQANTVYGYRHAYGCGFTGGTYKFNNCQFIVLSSSGRAFTMHDRQMTKGANISIDNCRFFGSLDAIRLGSVSTAPTHTVTINNCAFDCGAISLVEETAGSGVGCHYYVSGSGNTPTVEVITSTALTNVNDLCFFDDEIRFAILNSNMTKGKPVQVTTSGKVYPNNSPNFSGILMRSGSANDFVPIKRKGIIDIRDIGLTASSGNYIGVTNGNLAVVQNKADAIGYVYADYYLKLY